MWNKLPCPRSELELLFTLCGGQCFRWKKTGDNEYTGVFAKRVWILSQDDENILYKVITNTFSHTAKEIHGNDKLPLRIKGQKRKLKEPLGDKTIVEINENGDKLMTKIKSNECFENSELLRKYFRLDISLEEYYAQWSKKDPHFKEASDKFKGVRILAQDPVENVFSFICSSNNNISRISSMVEKLCTLYGDKITEVDGIMYHDFPSVEALIDPSVEKTLRDVGFGYRAKYIHQSACKIMEMGGTDWLTNLKIFPYEQAKTELMKLSGIGAKVADCVCLMSLGHLESIPVDTHIYQVAVQKYLPHLRAQKTVTDKIYNEIGDHFRSLYGSLAGWAHTILFCADLKMFQDNPTKTKTENPSKKKKRK